MEQRNSSSKDVLIDGPNMLGKIKTLEVQIKKNKDLN